jgi:4'-phosphopantetheinyl transferase
MPPPASARPGPAPADVLVALLPDRGDAAADHRVLAALAAPLVLESPGSALAVAHRCDTCGSTEHGRPLLVTADGHPIPGIHLSLSRAAGHIAFAATLAGPLGIDIESLEAVKRAGFDDVAFDALEQAALHSLAETRGPAAADRMRAIAWTAKEAVLKTTGTGLRADPRTVPLDLTRPDGLVVTRSGAQRLLVLRDVPAEVLGCLAVVADVPPGIRVVTPPFAH